MARLEEPEVVVKKGSQSWSQFLAAVSPLRFMVALATMAVIGGGIGWLFADVELSAAMLVAIGALVLALVLARLGFALATRDQWARFESHALAKQSLEIETTSQEVTEIQQVLGTEKNLAQAVKELAVEAADWRNRAIGKSIGREEQRISDEAHRAFEDLGLDPSWVQHGRSGWEAEKRGFVLWLTGLPASGKTTIARGLEAALGERGVPVETLDEDFLRRTLNQDLGYSKGDRDQEVMRTAFVALLLARQGVAVIVADTAPYEEMRRAVRTLMDDRFIEAFVQADVDTTSERDPKGLYSKAFAGEISEFTGVSDPYEIPTNPELVLDTENEHLGALVGQVVAYLEAKRFLAQPSSEYTH